MRSVADFGALSYLVGKAVGSGVPWFADLAEWLPPLPADLSSGGPAGDRLKTLGAGLAAYGAVALYHIAGYTPEARDAGTGADQRPARAACVIDSLDEAYRVMDADPDLQQIDLVTIGCPHASLSEIEQVADYLAGKTLRTRLWVTTGCRSPAQRGCRVPAIVQDHRGRRRRGGGRYLRRGRADADARRAQHGDQCRQDGLLRADAQRRPDALRRPGAVPGRGDHGEWRGGREMPGRRNTAGQTAVPW